MNKIQIVNWLLTRKCNLHCDYCRIVKNYKDQPKEYPPMKHYIENEMSTEVVIEGLRRIKLHNPDCFSILYGGEPLLRPDLFKIINYCNDNNIHYTIISNNTEKVQPLMKELFSKVEYIEGFTASIDPIIYQNKDNDIFKKSFLGFQKLKEYSSIIKDVVAEITVTNENLEYLPLLVKDLTNEGINSDITFVDIAKSPYYDFSDVTDDSILVKKSPELRMIINDLIDGDYNIHMKKTLLPKIYDTLPSELDCKLDEDFHTACIDADGSLRLCLRVRSEATPANFNVLNFIDENGKFNEDVLSLIAYDKRTYCLKCNHSCYIMSKMISDDEDNLDNLVHTEIRR
jgi:MoaA/NifB/PqqE/SkfB family radical SAM enzyme